MVNLKVIKNITTYNCIFVIYFHFCIFFFPFTSNISSYYRINVMVIILHIGVRCCCDGRGLLASCVVYTARFTPFRRKLLSTGRTLTIVKTGHDEHTFYNSEKKINTLQGFVNFSRVGFEQNFSYPHQRWHVFQPVGLLNHVRICVHNCDTIVNAPGGGGRVFISFYFPTNTYNNRSAFGMYRAAVKLISIVCVPV